jgi:hypothetical protein
VFLGVGVFGAATATARGAAAAPAITASLSAVPSIAASFSAIRRDTARRDATGTSAEIVSPATRDSDPAAARRTEASGCSSARASAPCARAVGRPESAAAAA